MISIDYFSDLEKNVDGVVLQYSTNGGLDWVVLGNNANGINWYNGTTILGKPGGQANLGSLGWTDKQSEWKNARFNLDQIPVGNRSQVRLRIAFGTNDGNASGATYDGFAFDNVFVGEKPRNVLVENFTNYNATNFTSTNNYLTNLYSTEYVNRKKQPDFRLIEYHLNYPATDSIYQVNPEHNDARSFMYSNGWKVR
jgi:hypothetical protein